MKRGVMRKVDDVALLEEELPGRDRCSDDADDQEHHVAQLAALRQLRNEKIPHRPSGSVDGP